MTLSFSSYIPEVFIRGILNMFFFWEGGGDCSGKVVSTLITWNISFSPPIEYLFREWTAYNACTCATGKIICDIVYLVVLYM